MLEKTLENPLDSKEIKPVNLKEINPAYSLEELKLKLQFFSHLMEVALANSLKETLMLGKIAGRRRRGQQRMRWLDGITNSTWVDMSLSSSRSWWRTGKPGVLQSTGSQKVRHDLITEQWTTSVLTDSLPRCRHHAQHWKFRGAKVRWLHLL